MSLRNFYVPETDSNSFFSTLDNTNRCVKTALVAVEGTFPDSSGRPFTFNSQRLRTIADFTNKALDKGIVIPLCLDHQVKFESTVGSIEGEAFTKVITETDLPNPKARELLGRVGLFVSEVVVKAPDAIAKVTNDIVRSVSMGLKLDKNDHRITEISLVPIPAISHMGLFHRGGGRSTFASTGSVGSENSAYTWEEIEINQRQLDDLREEYDDLVENLWNLLSNIYTSDAQEITDLNTLRQYVFSALNGFSVRTVDMLGLTDETGGQNVAENDANAVMTPAGVDDKSTQLKDLISRPTGFSSRNRRGARFNQGLLTNPIYRQFLCY
jgi:hypothetical protein